MWIQKDEVFVLQSNKQQGLTWSTAHSSHHNVVLPENVAYRFDVASLDTCHAHAARYDDKATIPKLCDRWLLVSLTIALLTWLIEEATR